MIGIDPVLDLPLNEGSGTTVYDRSGYNYNGTISGATWQKKWRDWLLYIDEVDDYVHCSPFLALPDSHTIMFWLYLFPISTGYWRQIFAVKGDNTDRNAGIWTHASYPQRIHWRYNPNNMGFNAVGAGGEGTDFALNTWYHICGVKDGTALRLYVSGSYVATVSVPSPMTVAVNPYYRIGATSYPPRNMIIANLLIVRKVLPENQISFFANLFRGELRKPPSL